MCVCVCVCMCVCVHVKTRGQSGRREEAGGSEDTVVVKKNVTKLKNKCSLQCCWRAIRGVK